MALRFDDNLIRSHLQQTLARWRAALQTRYQHIDQALELGNAHQRRRLVTTLAHWRSAQRKIQANIIRADKAYAFFLGREAMDVWKAALERKRETKVAEQVRLANLRSAFDGEPLRTGLTECS